MSGCQVTARVWKIHLRRIRNLVLCLPGLYSPDGTHEQAKERRPLPPFSSFSPSLLLTRYPLSSSLQPNSDPRSMKSLWHYVRDVYKGTEVSIREHGGHKRSPPPLRVLIGNKCLVLGLAPCSHFVGQMDVLLVQMLSRHSGSGLEEEE